MKSLEDLINEELNIVELKNEVIQREVFNLVECVCGRYWGSSTGILPRKCECGVIINHGI